MANRKPNLFRLGILVLPLYLAGCVTIPGGTNTSGLQSFNLGASDISDAFSPEMRELKHLVADSKFDEADALVIKDRAYFSKRLQGEGKAPPEAVKSLGEHVWKARYQPKADEALARLKSVSSLSDKTAWPGISRALEQAALLDEATENDLLVRSTQSGSSERKALKAEAARVTALAAANRQAALASSFDRLVTEGKLDSKYVGKDEFTASDYSSAPAFQALALNKVRSAPNKEVFFADATRLTPYLSAPTKATLDNNFVEFVRKDFLADGQISLDEVASLGGVKTPFGGAQEALGKMVAIGYVDLTGASFKGRNGFDFPIKFNQDLALKLAPASASVFSSTDISRFDYIFVTDLSAAKVSRQFKTKKDIKGHVQTGTREVQNANYISAMTNYQRAMAEFQRAQIKSAIPKYCQGLGCVFQGIADGLEQGVASKNVDQAASTLASTSQTLSEPVYSDYTYQVVDVETSKTAEVNYYVIDVKRKRILQNSLQVNDNEAVNVAYNVKDEDPNKASILSNAKPETEVTAWEKRPLTVSLAMLFSQKSLHSAKQTTYTDLQAFLNTLNSRTYVSAAPTYTQGSEPVASRVSSQTVADERFDSIVVLKNAKATGSGFYVTPDLILTTYHVVDGSSLVEISLYNGTKSYGKVVDYDVRLDLALVKPQTTGKPLKIYSGPIRLGETVEAIGHPKGYEFTITRGVVSAMRKQRSAAIGSENLVEFVQTDTPISPGNSGGPLLLKDAVVGVNDWIRVDKGSQNLNFSVSFNEVRAYLDRYAEKRP